MTASATPSSPLAALVAMAFIAGVVGSLWWNTREEAGDGAAAGSTARASGAASMSVAPPARKP